MRRRCVRWLALTFGVLILLAVASFIPTLWLRDPGMTEVRGEYVTLYRGSQEQAALDVLQRADGDAARLIQRLELSGRPEVSVYVYDSQYVMASHKYGWLVPLIGLDWYIGDNRGTNVLLTSPARPGAAHDYATVRDAVSHELVHAYVSTMNPDVRLWLTEGMALHLTNGKPLPPGYAGGHYLPTFEQTQTGNPIEFNEIGGYDLAHTYIAYVERNVGVGEGAQAGPDGRLSGLARGGRKGGVRRLDRGPDASLRPGTLPVAPSARSAGLALSGVHPRAGKTPHNGGRGRGRDADRRWPAARRWLRRARRTSRRTW